MDTESTQEAGDAIAGVVGRLSEAGHLTTLTTLDALIGAAAAEDQPAAAARLAKALADRIARSTAEIETALDLR